MSLRKIRTLLSLTLGLAAASAICPSLHADTLTTTPVSLNYNSSGAITNNGIANLISFNGNLNEPYNNNPTDPNPINNQLNLGNFLVSNSVSSTINTPTAISDPVAFTVMTDASDGYKLAGTVTGSLGNASPAANSLAATISSVSLIGSPPLALAIPINTPITLNLANGTNDGSTAFNIGAVPGVPSPTPAPEPASIALFAALAGGLGVWHRRRAR